MAAGVPPPPLNSPAGSYYWLEWYTNLTNFLNGTNIPWSNINFTGSNLTDLQTRNHNDLQNIQGGANNLHYHLLGAGVVSGTGIAVSLPGGWTCARTAVGTYTITHNAALANPAAFELAGTLNGTVGYMQLAASATNSFQVNTYGATGASVDAQFTFLCSAT